MKIKEESWPKEKRTRLPHARKENWTDAEGGHTRSSREKESRAFSGGAVLSFPYRPSKLLFWSGFPFFRMQSACMSQPNEVSSVLARCVAGPHNLVTCFSFPLLAPGCLFSRMFCLPSGLRVAEGFYPLCIDIDGPFNRGSRLQTPSLHSFHWEATVHALRVQPSTRNIETHPLDTEVDYTKTTSPH